jgi:hypothetical protein
MIKKNIFGGILLIAVMSFFSCSSPKPDTFLTEIGVCTSVSNADMLATHGYTLSRKV